jgi:hypothetical protein
MNAIFQRYAAAFLPFLIIVIGASQTVIAHPKDVASDVTFFLLVLGNILSFIVPLLKTAWQGGAKTGIAIVTVVVAAVLPFLLPTGFQPGVSIPIIVVAVLNAVAIEFGVQIRTAPTDLPPVKTAPPLVVNVVTPSSPVTPPPAA